MNRVADTASVVVVDKQPLKAKPKAVQADDVNKRFDALGLVRKLSCDEAQLLQDRFNAMCVSGDIEGVKEMWKQDR